MAHSTSPNHLIHETSPYLLQHAYNPVDWYAWKKEALEKAERENKLLLISIGYSSCHWCHVMEKESFSDNMVAEAMNTTFVNIKVDREERPDIDDIYMTACQLANGTGCGWPLNAIALPDGRPVWAGTYFPKHRWMEVLGYFRSTWENDPDKLIYYADLLSSGIRDHGLEPVADEEEVISQQDISEMAGFFMQYVDPAHGGRRGAPKFPMPNNWLYLMEYAHRYCDQKAMGLVNTTLQRMMRGGIYDHLEGGFARYATDATWLVPHFEKMLYDNGQLLSLYAQAYALTGDTRYLFLVRQTIDFCSSQWGAPEGGYYSSLDADSEGEEGKYYVWTTAELNELIPEGRKRQLFYTLHDIRPEGNWEEGKNILHHHRELSDVAAGLGLSIEEATAQLQDINITLLNIRAQRVAPSLDDKILTSWNGLMLHGLTDACRATQDDIFRQLAIRLGSFIVRDLIQDDFRISRNYKNGTTAINGFLDDYATVIQGFLSLYQITFDEDWLNQADGLTRHVIDHFSSDESDLFYFTSDLDPPLVARRIDYSDNVIPSANSMMAHNLLLLGNILHKEDYSTRARRMFQQVWPRIKADKQPGFYSNWCRLMPALTDECVQVAIVGPDCHRLLAEMQKHYLPGVIFIGSTEESTIPLLAHKYLENSTLIYVCHQHTCKAPVTSVQEALALLAE